MPTYWDSFLQAYGEQTVDRTLRETLELFWLYYEALRTNDKKMKAYFWNEFEKRRTAINEGYYESTN